MTRRLAGAFVSSGLIQEFRGPGRNALRTGRPHVLRVSKPSSAPMRFCVGLQITRTVGRNRLGVAPSRYPAARRASSAEAFAAPTVDEPIVPKRLAGLRDGVA